MAAPVTLSIIPGQPTTGAGAGVPVLVTVAPPAGQQRTPSDICCVLDISWSMSMEAKVQAAGGAVESNGLSMLDIAKHAVRTIIRTLGPQDRLAMVQFCRVAETVLPLTEMTEAGQALAEARLDSVSFGNGTALWEGIRKGLEALQAGADVQGRLGHIMLLTDGETEDKAAVMGRLREFKTKHERLPGTINAFGFGYEIDSPLLVEIASFSDGSYAFIPDAGFVGTCFVNSMSNLLVTMARDATLALEAQEGAEVLEVLGGWETRSGSGGGISVSLGSLQYGQTKDVVLRMSGVAPGAAPYLVASLEYSTASEKARAEAEGKATGEEAEEAGQAVEMQRCRSLIVSALQGAVEAATPSSEEALKAAQEIVSAAAAQVAASPAKDTEQGAGLLEDLLGQSTEALSRLDYWQKWGRHYIPSVASAHKLQQCNNFKDPGVQCYGGKLFEEIRDVADAAFDALPAPKITPARYRYLGAGRVVHNPSFDEPGRLGAAPAPAAAPSVSMAAYNDRYAGCVDGACLVQLASGGLKRLATLAKGDVVMGLGGAAAEVVCVARSRCASGRAHLTELPGCGGGGGVLRLTPHHPVHAEGEWRFPCDLGTTEERECEAVYSFVLRGAPAALVEGVPCAALGHGLREGAAAHPYFASGRVLEDLAAFPGFDAGLVELPPGSAVRDAETGLVCGLRAEPPRP